MANYPQLALNWALDVIFPSRCLKCGKFLAKSRGYICKKCMGLIPIKKGFECIGCKRAVVLGKTCIICRKNESIDQLLIISDYKNELVVKMLKALKYRFISEVAIPLSVILRKHLHWLSVRKNFNVLAEEPIILPVPLHRRRLNWRGFNQAEIITKELCSILACNFYTEVIERTKDTKTQADIEEKRKRLENIKTAFRVTDAEIIKNRVVILVDDICTSGATLNECARVLKEAGARKVIGLVFARG